MGPSKMAVSIQTWDFVGRTVACNRILVTIESIAKESLHAISQCAPEKRICRSRKFRPQVLPVLVNQKVFDKMDD